MAWSSLIWTIYESWDFKVFRRWMRWFMRNISHKSKSRRKSMLWKGVAVNDVNWDCRINWFFSSNLKFILHSNVKVFEVELHNKISEHSLMFNYVCTLRLCLTVKFEHNLRTLPIHFTIDFIFVSCIRSDTAAFSFAGTASTPNWTIT